MKETERGIRPQKTEQRQLKELLKHERNEKGEYHMLNKIFNKKKDNKGFTLVELVIVVAILAILVGLLAPQYTKYVEKSRKSADANNLEEMVKAFQVTHADLETGIEDGTYVITVSAAADVAFTYTGTASDATSGTPAADITNSMEEILGSDWQDTVLKSKNWDNDAISATFVVTDGVITVTYNPTTLKQSLTD